MSVGARNFVRFIDFRSTTLQQMTRVTSISRIRPTRQCRMWSTSLMWYTLAVRDWFTLIL